MGLKAIFFDRDGTLIENKHYLNDPSDIDYMTGVFEALSRLKQAGYKLFVVTNQSGIPRGLVQEENLHETHRRMQKEFEKHGFQILEFYFSPYLPESNHPTRKPNPGMLLAAQQEYSVDMKQSWMVGDKMLDVEAGHRAGARSILVGEKDNNGDPSWKAPEAHVSNLKECVEFILKQDKN